MKNIIENFDRAADRYESLARPQAALAAELADWIKPEERKGSALELGAGTGLFTRQVLPWDGTYTATDAAPKMVALGRQLCPRVEWKVMDARSPNGASPVNWIFACSLLQWFPEPLAVLQAWRKFLRLEGQLALAVLLPGTLGELQSVLPEAKPLNWHPASAWRDMVARAGFAVEREQEWEQPCLYPNSLELLRSIHAMGLAPHRAVTGGRLRTALREYNHQHARPGVFRPPGRPGWCVRERPETLPQDLNQTCFTFDKPG